LSLEAAKALLGDLHCLLNQEIPAAAEAIRALTGPITIRQEKIPGKKRGAKWIAKFTPDLLAWLRQTGRARNCPDSITLEYLSTRNWITPEPVEIPIDRVPKYEQIAEKVQVLAKTGSSVENIARIINVPWETVRDAIRFAQTGKRPAPRDRSREKKSSRRPKQLPKKVLISAEVARLRDDEQLPFLQIADRLRVDPSTVTRAYDLAHPELLKAAEKTGRTPVRGGHSRLGSRR
jgi:hypothetical protein